MRSFTENSTEGHLFVRKKLDCPLVVPAIPAPKAERVERAADSQSPSRRKPLVSPAGQ